ncbi:hypothetical protein [Streptomyces cucumeris]|uniref:hypothetical protein n=1 Tax=Streptomyces cucumeris TaxID=2962890 RepID=UPI0020C8EDE7|nr:hypothetical protein [Streptomyces sp. NEAU-Y11]MCP9210397.1 hypothetical protein [Streptomyces sp. NEAU-Y11]
MPSRRALIIVTLVLAVVAGGGYLTKPLWQPWWYAETLCGDHVSGDDLAELLPRKRLQAGEDTFGSGHGRLVCAVNEDEGHFVLRMEAQTDPSDVRTALGMEFTIPTTPRYVFPQEVPGFYGKFGPVIIQKCPGPGHDSRGHKRLLITRVVSHGVEDDATPASLRIAVSVANGADSELGCGADPLPLPERVVEPRTMPLKQAAGTMCGWLTRAPLPKSPSGAGWRVAAPTHNGAPITNCSLIDPETGDSALDLTGWYGGWTDTPFETLLGANVVIPKGHDSRDALMSEDFGRAKARCGGESANFLAYGDGTDRKALSATQMRTLLNAFATDQTRRRGCTGLDVPDSTVHPKRG